MGTPVTGTVGSGTTLTSSIPVLIGGVDANGVARTLVVNSDGSLPASGLDDIAKTGLGFQSWNVYPLSTPSTSSALTSQTIYAMAVPYRAGQVVTNTVWSIATAAVGTAPTGMFVGLCSASTMLMDSTNLNGNAAWKSTGLQAFALTSAYTILTSGIYYHLLLQNGTFASTQPAFNRVASTGPANPSAPTKFLYATAGASQTALPAVSAAVTLASTGTPLAFITAST